MLLSDYKKECYRCELHGKGANLPQQLQTWFDWFEWFRLAGLPQVKELTVKEIINTISIAKRKLRANCNTQGMTNQNQSKTQHICGDSFKSQLPLAVLHNFLGKIMNSNKH